MSAYRYLIFVMGTILVALLGAFMVTIINPTLGMLNSYSSSPESATGIMWYSEFVDLLPLLMIMLLGFMFIYGIVVRRGRVRP